MKNKLVGIIYIFLAILILILNIFGVNSTSNDGISKENAKTTSATIVNLNDIETDLHTRKRKLSKLYYNIYILLSYNVGGIEYTNSDSYSMTNKTELINKFHVGDTITITYDSTNPNKMFIGMPDYSISRYTGGIIGFIICMVVGIVFIIKKDKPFFDFLNKTYVEEHPMYKKKTYPSKQSTIVGLLFLVTIVLYEFFVHKTYETETPMYPNISSFILIVGIIFIIYFIYKSIISNDIINKSLKLKVLQVDTIDYERERVFFSGDDQLMYLYETDFGEEFKTNEIYTVNLSANNQNSIHTDFQGQNIKVIQIVNIEKSAFLMNNIENT